MTKSINRQADAIEITPEALAAGWEVLRFSCEKEVPDPEVYEAAVVLTLEVLGISLSRRGIERHANARDKAGST